MRDFSSIAKEKEIQWVRYWIDASYEFSRNFIKSGTNEIDFEALGREEWEFRKALKTKDFSKNERAEYLWNEAMAIHKKNAVNGKKGGRPKKSPQDAPNGNAGVDMPDAGNGAASKSPTSCGQLTGDASTREDEDAVRHGHTAAGAAHTTVSNAMGADAVDGDTTDDKSGTSASKTMPRVRQNEAPAHGFSGGRPVQGSMSRSPEAAAQSGKDYKQNRDADAVDGDTTGATTSGESRRDRASATSASAPLTCNTADTVPQRGSKRGKTYDQDADNIDDKHNNRGADAATREGAEAIPSGESRANWASGQSAPRTFKGHKKQFKAPSKEELYAYAQDKGLDEADARDCWEMCESRQWADRDGVQIENWKTFVAGFCKSRQAKRSA